MYTLLFISCLLLARASANYICTQTSDCTHLGSELVCVKSMCNYGICGCPRDLAARFMGSASGFRCLPIRSIGQTCHHLENVCGAGNCVLGYCTCVAPSVPAWGGENCISIGHVFATETQSGGLGTNCQNGGGATTPSRVTGPTYALAPGSQGINAPSAYMMDHSQCGCPRGTHTTIRNWPWYAPWHARKAPRCEQNVHGDKCLVDADCGPSSLNMACYGGMCACINSNLKPNIDGTQCDTPLAFGSNCKNTGTPVANSVCDGTLGLACGDICNLASYSNNSYTLTCDCAPTYLKSGTTCSKRALGSACYGDFNCKAITKNTVCVAGTCQSSGLKVAVSVVTMVMCVLLALINN